MNFHKLVFGMEESRAQQIDFMWDCRSGLVSHELLVLYPYGKDQVYYRRNCLFFTLFLVLFASCFSEGRENHISKWVFSFL
jgi:hypothetical protein